MGDVIVLRSTPVELNSDIGHALSSMPAALRKGCSVTESCRTNTN